MKLSTDAFIAVTVTDDWVLPDDGGDELIPMDEACAVLDADLHAMARVAAVWRTLKAPPPDVNGLKTCCGEKSQEQLGRARVTAG